MFLRRTSSSASSSVAASADDVLELSTPPEELPLDASEMIFGRSEADFCLPGIAKRLFRACQYAVLALSAVNDAGEFNMTTMSREHTMLSSMLTG